MSPDAHRSGTSATLTAPPSVWVGLTTGKDSSSFAPILAVPPDQAERVESPRLRTKQGGWSYLAFLAEVLIPTLRTESHVAAATGGWLRSCRPWTHGAGLATSRMRVVAASIIIPLRLAAPSPRASAAPTADTTAVAWSISVWEGPPSGRNSRSTPSRVLRAGRSWSCSWLPCEQCDQWWSPLAWRWLLSAWPTCGQR
jgi:hypothetical protein